MQTEIYGRHLDAMNKFYESLPFVAAVLFLIIRAFQMQPLKDNKPWRRFLSMAFGLAFIVWGLVSIGTGHITFLRRNTRTYFVTRDPVEFWVVVGIAIGLGVLLIYRGIIGRR
jgi:hypothetical protein